MRSKNKLGQYFTPESICEFMIGLSTASRESRVLEPSSGQGAFLNALMRKGFKNVVPVEIDPKLATHSEYSVLNQSFITYTPEESFDLVIGNPPYIRWKDLEEEQKNELKNHWMFGPILNSLSDYLLPFIALSIQHLREGGELIFITPSFWLQTKHSQNLRDFLVSHGTVTHVIDFGEVVVFDKVSTSLIIFRFVKGSREKKTTLMRYVSKSGGRNLNLALDSFRIEEINHFQSKGKFVPIFDMEASSAFSLEAECADHQDLFGDVRYSTLGDAVKIANGMVTGLDQAFKLPADLFENLSSEERLGTSSILKGKDIHSLYSPQTSKYIDLPRGLSSKEIRRRFPTLIEHLSGFQTGLENRYSYDDDERWWEWSFYRSDSFHRNQHAKGFVPGKERLTNRTTVRFTLSPRGSLATQDVTAFAPYPATKESIEYIVAFLNLEAVTNWIRAFGLMKGGVAEFSEKPLSEIPLRRIDWSIPREAEMHNEITNLMQELRNGSGVEGSKLKLAGLFAELMLGQKG